MRDDKYEEALRTWRTSGPSKEETLAESLKSAISTFAGVSLFLLAVSFPFSWVWGAYLEAATGVDIGPREALGAVLIFVLFLNVKMALTAPNRLARMACATTFTLFFLLAAGVAAVTN